MIKTELDEAVTHREAGRPDGALAILERLIRSHPQHPDINYQMAWTLDSMGRESAAVPFYEKALANGLQEGRLGAMLGLGSTYRCLGDYEKSLAVFDQALSEFPECRSLKVFRALTLYNLGRSADAVSQLLVELLETTQDESIRSYEKALRFYADKLDQTWK